MERKIASRDDADRDLHVDLPRPTSDLDPDHPNPALDPNPDLDPDYPDLRKTRERNERKRADGRRNSVRAVERTRPCWGFSQTGRKFS